MSQEDLDTVMMDFGPDIDLLDELLGLDPTIDWCKLEPSLGMNFDPPSPHSPLGPELPMLPMMGLQPLTPESVPSPGATNSSRIILSQLSPQPMPTHQAPQVVPLAPLTALNTLPPLKIKCNNVVSPAPVTPLSSTTMSPPVSQQQQVQFTTTPSFTGFGIPFTPAMFGGNAVLLPQIQLAVVENRSQVGKKGNKLPVKRLEKDAGHGSRKKEPTNRRSSHNAIERRYRSSINDKILELKNLVCAPGDSNEKVHKAAILRSSIDSIRYLQNTNGRLDKENRELKKSMSQCPTCRNDVTLRGILASSAPATPPPTESESTDSSNPPSPNEDLKPSPRALINKSPLVLFSLVTGLFLINPITNYSNPMTIDTGNGDHPHSRVERSVDDGLGTKGNPLEFENAFYSLWFPRILTIFINLFIFIFVYYITGKVSNRVWRTKYTTEKLILLKNGNWNKAGTNSGKIEELGNILSEFDNFPTNWFTRGIGTLINLVIMPFQLRRKSTNVKYVEINEEISNLYLEYGKLGGKGIFPYLRSINFSPINKQVLIRNLIQAKSKLLLKYVLLWTDFSEHPTWGTPEGLLFLKAWISKGVNASTEFTLTGNHAGGVGGDEVTSMISKFREEMLFTGIQQLFHFGAGSDLFRIVLKSCGKNDKVAQFWTTIMWAEAEWIQGSGRTETLKRLYRLMDELWKHLNGRDETLLKAIYKVHLCKRAVMLDQSPSKEMLDSASARLRDSINTSTDKPKRVVQLIWCLAAEWILECRLELWEETKEFGGFSKDLDTLRSLTHYIPAVLPSVYLYEACQRLMNYAAPGRTQQLLDASLRQIRTNQRTLICNNSNSDEGTPNSSEDSLTPPNCKLGKKSMELNLVREKRKAFALFLKCKYLPNQVITCPGEKAGMLKEALKALERVGEKKKINECLEMIRALGQNITLH